MVVAGVPIFEWSPPSHQAFLCEYLNRKPAFDALEKPLGHAFVEQVDDLRIEDITGKSAIVGDLSSRTVFAPETDRQTVVRKLKWERRPEFGLTYESCHTERLMIVRKKYNHGGSV